MLIKKKWILFAIGILSCYGLLQCLPRNIPIQKNHFLNTNREVPLVIAHGGAKKLYPENTIYAFNQVYDMQVDAIEVDIRMSKDFELCSIHDESISHYTNQKGRVQDYTYEELSSFNFGYHFKNANEEYEYRNVNANIKQQLIPMRIEDMFSKFKNNILYILEIKEEGIRGKQCANLLYQLIKEYKLEDYVCVASFDDEVINYVKHISKNSIIVSMGYNSAKEFVVSNYIGYDLFKTFPNNGMLLPLEARNISLDDKYLLYKAHRHQKFVYYWTIDDEEQMKKLIDNKVDGIISDRPDKLMEMINNRNKKVSK